MITIRIPKDEQYQEIKHHLILNGYHFKYFDWRNEIDDVIIDEYYFIATILEDHNVRYEAILWTDDNNED